VFVLKVKKRKESDQSKAFNKHSMEESNEVLSAFKTAANSLALMVLASNRSTNTPSPTNAPLLRRATTAHSTK
jgi:hypothetical protein